MTNKRLFFVLLIVIIGGISCSKGKNIPDVSNINVQFNVQRFDQELSHLDTTNIEESVRKLEEKYPVFSEIYFKNVLPFRRGQEADNSQFYKNIKGFLANKQMHQLMDTCTLIFQNFEPLEAEFEEAFQFYQYYFPQAEIPDLYTFISEYSYQTFIFDDQNKDGLGIGLDMFLGETYPYRQYVPENPSFSAYLTRAFNKEHLVKKTLEALIEDKVGIQKGERLLDYMIHNGKKIYILDQLLPHHSDEVKLEYTMEQLDWCKDNELQIWTYLLGEELLYTTERKKIRKLIDPSPNGPSDMPPEAPGRTANWMGWQIVKSYMQRHPNITLGDLILKKDAQKIMDAAKYKPKRK